MALHKDEAIILFKRAYGESDKIIRLFTLTSGKVAAIAKGANKSQKRFMNTLEPFNRINVEYFEKQGRGMVRIENADIIETNSGIETSLKRACTAGFFTEFVDRLTKERERHDELFYVLKEVLRGVKEAEFTYKDILHYQLRMLTILGFMPNFTTCVYCGCGLPDEKRIFFSSERGGTLCAGCAHRIPHKAYPEGVMAGFITVAQTRNNPECGLVGAAIEGNRRSRNVPGPESPGVFAGTAQTSDFTVKEDTRPFSAPAAKTIDGQFERAAREIMEDFMSFHLDVDFKSYRILRNLVLK